MPFHKGRTTSDLDEELAKGFNLFGFWIIRYTLSISSNCFLLTGWCTLTRDRIQFSKRSSLLMVRTVLGLIPPNDLYVSVTLATECIFATVASDRGRRFPQLPKLHLFVPYYNSFLASSVKADVPVICTSMYQLLTPLSKTGTSRSLESIFLRWLIYTYLRFVAFEFQFSSMYQSLTLRINDWYTYM